MSRFVARRSQTIPGLGPSPIFGRVGPNVIETIKGMLHTGVSLERSGFHVEYPAVDWRDILKDQFVVDRLLVD